MRDGGRLNVLCLSGGGYRGLYSAVVLDKICRGLDIPDLRPHFDLIVGTSTGALVASALALGLPPHAIAAAFMRNGPKIFPQQWSMNRVVRQLRLLPQYKAERVAAAVREMVPQEANSFIEDLEVPLALVSLSRIQQTHRVFLGKPFALAGSAKTPLVKAILASSAAPTYFPEQKVGADRLVDGGLVANAPVLIGASLLKEHRRAPPHSIHVLHIGTSSTTDHQRFDPTAMQRYFLPAGWLRRFRGATRDLVTLTMAAQESLAVNLARTWLGEQYIYIDAPENLRTGPELARLDDASHEATQRLLMLAEATWVQWKQNPHLRAFFPIAPPALSNIQRFGRPRIVS